MIRPLSLLLALLLTMLPTTVPAQEATVFAPPHWGLSITPPAGWGREEPGPYAVLFVPPDSVLGGAATAIGLRNLRRPDDVAAEDGADVFARQLVEQLRTQAEDAEIRREATFRWDIGDAIVGGRQVVADFMRNGLPLRQWTVLVPSPHAPVVHLWQYTAPQAVFDTHLEAARACLESLRPKAPTED